MPSTRRRVPAPTREDVNRRIRHAIERSVHYYERHPAEIPERLRELDAEWDIERAVEANAAALSFVGVLLGVGRGKRWLMLPAVVGGLLFQHAVQGWCPPAQMLRRLGFRTFGEIDEERQALKAIRGDYRDIRPGDGRSVLRAVRA
ncbi:MAG: DUF2892 domain-containing protein [Xanthobacteraceae bacterium]|nr:DUF2892 domain-containing protein [Xanthobacteraceae bacterium]